MAALMVVAGLAFGAMVFAFAFFALLLKLAIRLILFPLFLLKWIVALVAMIVVGPVLAVVGTVLALTIGLVVAIPFMPLIALAAIAWLIVKSTRRAVV